MKLTKKIISMILAVVMVLGLLPTIATATEEEYVYLSISFDGQYINDQNNNPIIYLPISLSEIAAIDLTQYYGMDEMGNPLPMEAFLFDADGDGNHEVTALHLMIYAHEVLYGGDFSNVTITGGVGSMYLKNGIFGFTENLVYFLNGDFPIYEDLSTGTYNTGATADRIVLQPGDFLDVASFSCYSFLWDAAGGFHLFADEEDNYVHNYTVAAQEPLNVKLIHSFCDLMVGMAWTQEATDYEVFYGSTYGQALGSVFTDDTGCAEITFDKPGTYYVWCDGGPGSDDMAHSLCDYYNETYELCTVSAPAYATVTVTGNADAPVTPTERLPQDVSDILNATMAQLVATVTAPSFGTNAGEWTVFGLARGNYFTKDNAYFTDYYDRIVEYVNKTAAQVNNNGALDSSKSTENSRLIVALSALGKDATSVGTWDLVKPYTANGLRWIGKQGMNGVIWALIALDSNPAYAAETAEIRQQCVDYVLKLQHNDGGWSLTTDKTATSNVDITGMTLTALYPYRDQEAVAAACDQAIGWLSEAQLASGGFPYGADGETSESCAWAIVACATWGINPDTDPRFIKNGNSIVDNLLSYYIADEAMFAHQGKVSNNMATDQATYALVAYQRLLNKQSPLYDYSDVVFDAPAPSNEAAVSLSLPSNINTGGSFNGIITINKWDNNAGYKLVDMIVNVPAGVAVTDVVAGSKLLGGEVRWNLEAQTGKLRIVYFDANQNSDLTISGDTFPAELFTIEFQAENVEANSELNISIAEMSLKLNSDSQDEASSNQVNTNYAGGTVEVVMGISFQAKCLYTGDGVDLIPANKMAVAVSVTGITAGNKLVYNDGTNLVEFLYNEEISAKTGVATYVALVDAAIEMESFASKDNYTIGGGNADDLTFGDVNGDGVINAQDALAVVDAWLRKGDAPEDEQILSMNVNGDSRINTFDALGIVEKFVDGSDLGVVTKAATITTNQ